MGANLSDPFFVQFSTFPVHSPIDEDQARSDLLTKYEAKTPGVTDDNASYAAVVEGLDQSVGRLVDYLQSTDDPNNPGQTLDQNTLVIFYSDNGGVTNRANNGGLTGGKGSLSEGGVRVPMITWSGNDALVDAGTVSDEIVMPIDFYTTFTALADGTLPGEQTFDGIDLSKILADGTADSGREAVYWHLPAYPTARSMGPASAIHQRIDETDWKLLYYYESQTWELYNLDTDMDESDNLADRESAIAEALGLNLLAWLDETDAPLATIRSGTIQIVIDGTYYAYANGEVTSFADELLTFNAGEELPLFMPVNVPEPSSMTALGLLGLGLLRRRR